MNKQYILGLALVCIIASCKKENLTTYNAGHYIQFVSKDTVNFSFFFYAGQTEVDVALPVRLIGKMPEQDLPYKIIPGDGTTLPAELFTIADGYAFKKGQPLDTAHIKIKNRADLATTSYKLFLTIATAGDVQPGQTSYNQRLYLVSNMVVKPAWWTSDVDTKYLGVYTEKKYRTFMAVTGVGDVTPYTDVEKRDLYLKLKSYLIAMKDAGTPVLEADGTDMLSTIPLIG